MCDRVCGEMPGASQDANEEVLSRQLSIDALVLLDPRSIHCKAHMASDHLSDQKARQGDTVANLFHQGTSGS